MVIRSEPQTGHVLASGQDRGSRRLLSYLNANPQTGHVLASGQDRGHHRAHGAIYRGAPLAPI
jgi:hypothetical protein